MKHLHFSKILLTVVLLISGLFIGSGCKARTGTGPPLADSTLVPILVELHLARARQNLEGDLHPSIRDSIFQRHDADSTTFARTLSYYTNRPEAYTQIYKRVVDRLHEQRKTVPKVDTLK